jgi:hypothetical protein
MAWYDLFCSDFYHQIENTYSNRLYDGIRGTNVGCCYLAATVCLGAAVGCFYKEATVDDIDGFGQILDYCFASVTTFGSYFFARLGTAILRSGSCCSSAQAHGHQDDSARNETANLITTQTA